MIVLFITRFANTSNTYNPFIQTNDNRIKICNQKRKKICLWDVVNQSYSQEMVTNECFIH